MEDYNKVLNFQPHKIPKDFIADPNSGLRIFFSLHPLTEVRENFELLFRAWMKQINIYAEPSDILAMLLFKEQIIEFVEVSFVKGVKDGYLSINQPKE